MASNVAQPIRNKDRKYPFYNDLLSGNKKVVLLTFNRIITHISSILYVSLRIFLSHCVVKC